MKNMSSKEFFDVAWKIVTALAAVLVAFGVLTTEPIGDAAPETNEATARGVTNFDSLTLSDDLVVGDDATISGDLAVTGATTYGAGGLYGLLIDDSSEAIFVSSGTITGTEVITTSTHGLTTVTTALCTLGESPGTGAGDGALCWALSAGGTVTITVEQDDWTTDASNGTVIDYAIIGTP